VAKKLNRLDSLFFALLAQKRLKRLGSIRIGFAKPVLEAISRATFEIAAQDGVGVETR
jgi:hypothetical protein